MSIPPCPFNFNKNKTMRLKLISIIAFVTAVAGVVFLYFRDQIFSKNPITIAIQVIALGLMLWARFTFGMRSFHAAANTTTGRLVTTGPYRLLRHPIYAAIIYFFIGSFIAYPFLETFITVILIAIALFVRMLMEEKSLLVTYPEYAAYMKRTKRIIPFVI